MEATTHKSSGGFCLLTHPDADLRVLAYITERPREGYRYEIVTLHGKTELTQRAFRRAVAKRRQRLSVAPRFHSAMAGCETVRERRAVLSHLAQRLPGYDVTPSTKKVLA